jgi:hypothetical protein
MLTISLDAWLRHRSRLSSCEILKLIKSIYHNYGVNLNILMPHSVLLPPLSVFVASTGQPAVRAEIPNLV